MTVTILLFLVGLFLIIKGGDVFVDRAVWISEAFNIPKFIIGATIVSIATTLPELLVSIIATSSGNSSIAVGNAIGSVTANTSLIMSIGLIFLAKTIDVRDFKMNMLCLMCSITALMLVCKNGIVSPVGSTLLFGMVIIFFISNIMSSKDESELESDGSKLAIPIIRPSKKEVFINAILFALSAAAIAFGAKFLVESGTEIAKALGVSDRIIGITIIAIGTSLPELVTTITAITKKQGGLSIGNIIGANVIDLSLILPICSFVSLSKFGIPLNFDAHYGYLDIPVCMSFIFIACLPPIIRNKFSWVQGVLLLILYLAYISFSIIMTS